jgi:hypothetical protein
MDDKVGFGIRLRVRLAGGLTTKETKLNISFAGKEVSVNCFGEGNDAFASSSLDGLSFQYPR